MHISSLSFLSLAVIVVADSQVSQPIIDDTKSSGCNSLVVDCTLGYNSSMNKIMPQSPSPTGSFHDNSNLLPGTTPISGDDQTLDEKSLAEGAVDNNYDDDDDDDDDDDTDDDKIDDAKVDNRVDSDDIDKGDEDKDGDDNDDEDKDDDDKDDDDKDDDDKDDDDKDDNHTIGNDHRMPEKQIKMPGIYHQVPEEYILKTVTVTTCIATVTISVITLRKPGPTQDRPHYVDEPMPTGWFPKPIDNKNKPELPRFTGAANVNRHSTFLVLLACVIAFLV